MFILVLLWMLLIYTYMYYIYIFTNIYIYLYIKAGWITFFNIGNDHRLLLIMSSIFFNSNYPKTVIFPLIGKLMETFVMNSFSCKLESLLFKKKKKLIIIRFGMFYPIFHVKTTIFQQLVHTQGKQIISQYSWCEVISIYHVL